MMQSNGELQEVMKLAAYVGMVCAVIQAGVVVYLTYQVWAVRGVMEKISEYTRVIGGFLHEWKIESKKASSGVPGSVVSDIRQPEASAGSGVHR